MLHKFIGQVGVNHKGDNTRNDSTHSSRYLFTELKKSWVEAWSVTPFRIQFVITLVIVFSLGINVGNFFSFIQLRSGNRINDVLLNTITPHDFSFFIFSLIYLGVVVSIITLATSPRVFVKCLQAYCLLSVLRIISVYAFALEPDQAIIPLNDPFVSYFFFDSSSITKDLFFSGHVSTMFLFTLFNPDRKWRFFLMANTLMIAILILLQHVHYTIDIVAAPVFSWICYKLINRIPLEMGK